MGLVPEPGEDRIEGTGGLCEAVETASGAAVMISAVVFSGRVFCLLLSVAFGSSALLL